MLAKLVDEKHRDWDECLPLVLAAYRASKHESTGYSPNCVIFGRENRAPADLCLPNAPGTPLPLNAESLDSYVERVAERTRDAYRLVRDHLSAAAERRKEAYDTKVRSVEFRTGDWVWYYYPRRRRGRSPKWSSYYTGPYEVVREIPPCNFVLRKNQRAKPFVVHADKLKICLGRPANGMESDGAVSTTRDFTGYGSSVARRQDSIPYNHVASLNHGSSPIYECEDYEEVRRSDRRRRPTRPFSPS